MQTKSLSAKKISEELILSLKRAGEEDLLPEIINNLKRKLKKDSKEEKLFIYSAIPLSSEFLRRIASIFEKKYQKKFKAENIIDKEILGGLLIRYKDLVLDLSLKGDLDKIIRSLFSI